MSSRFLFISVWYIHSHYMSDVARVYSCAALLQKMLTIRDIHRQVLNLPSGHVTVTLFCVNTMQTFTDTL